jgi:hypothetical protein
MSNTLSPLLCSTSNGFKRPSLWPSKFPEDYQRFVRKDASAVNEDAVKDSVVLAMLNAMGAFDGAWNI